MAKDIATIKSIEHSHDRKTTTKTEHATHVNMKGNEVFHWIHQKAVLCLQQYTRSCSEILSFEGQKRILGRTSEWHSIDFHLSVTQTHVSQRLATKYILFSLPSEGLWIKIIFIQQNNLYSAEDHILVSDPTDKGFELWNQLCLSRTEMRKGERDGC